MASQAAAREQQAIVERHTLKAPFAGVISERHTELGEWVNPGDGLLELVATDKLLIMTGNLAPIDAVVLFGILGAAIVSVTMLPALTISVLEWNKRR